MFGFKAGRVGMHGGGGGKGLQLIWCCYLGVVRCCKYRRRRCEDIRCARDSS